jgi:hypothetical protein
MQIVESHVKYNISTDQTHLKQTTVVVGVRVNLKKVTSVLGCTILSVLLLQLDLDCHSNLRITRNTAYY